MNKPRYSHLLSPGRIGPLTLRNRLVVTAMGVNFAREDGISDDRLVAFHENQARGGAGLVISGAASIMHPVAMVQPRQIAVSRDVFIPGLKRIADAVHRHGARFIVQIQQGGLMSGDDNLAGRPLWCPSVPQPMTGDFIDGFLPEELALFSGGAPTYKVLTPEDIQVVTQHFAAAALRCRAAGCDGVEIHAGHGYLLQSFLSPCTNRRTDGYGGSRENRARFLVEVIQAVRAAVGQDFAVTAKIDACEFGVENGITLEDAKVTARLAEAAGVDALTVTSAHDRGTGKLHSGSNVPHIPNTNLPFAAAIRSMVQVPVIGSGRVEPGHGDAEIAAGRLDFLSMGRKLLADPELPNKLAGKNTQPIRPCIYCYTCISAIYTLDSTRCAVNPECGLEYQRLDLPRHSRKKRVVIVGGGPAGMETARRLSAGAHEVTLLEQSDRLGGTLRFAALAYPPNQDLLEWLVDRVGETNIDIRLNTPATPELLHALQPDHVIVATGARRDMPPIPGADLPHVFSGDELRRLLQGEASPELTSKTSWLTRAAIRLGASIGLTQNIEFIRSSSHHWMPFGDSIAIIGGELVGLELAEFLVERGRTVSVIDTEPRLGRGLSLVRRLRLLADLRERGVTLLAGAANIHIAKDGVHCTNSEGLDTKLPAHHVIVAKGARGDATLGEQLQQAGFNVLEVGDCTGIGYIEGAMRGAMQAADAVAAT